MKIIVQKFGGTSVSTRENRLQAIKKIKQALSNDYSIVVVVSAMGRKGEPYATDSLLNLLGHCNCSKKRETDLLLNCGEIISAVVFSHELQDENIESVVLTGQQAGIITDDCFGEARILSLRPSKILTHLEKGKLVIVTGFQGSTEENELTTLGRGGSDTTATALGVALDAEVVEIYTDVEGIMTADPKIVENARILDVVTYNEICHLAYQGAKVIHPRAVEMAMQKNIPLRVKSTFSDVPGTLVTTSDAVKEQLTNERLITGIAYLTDVTQINIDFKSDKYNTIPLNVFSKLADAGISVDFINVGSDYASFTVKDVDRERSMEILNCMDMDFHSIPNCAKVSVVGANMTGVPGVMAKIIDALSAEEIKILQTSDSYTTIWCLVSKEDLPAAVRALHKKFDLDRK